MNDPYATTGITPYTAKPPLPAPPPFCIIACLVLSKTDRLRFMGFPERCLPAIRDSISRYWPRGIQSEGVYEAVCWEYKLGGRPCECPESDSEPGSTSMLTGWRES